MIKELKDVIEVVDDLKATNLVNVQILKKALTDINSRLEEISDGDELIFIRNSIAEFKETLDYKIANVMEHFNELKLSSQNDPASVENVELMEAKFKSLSSIFDSSIKLLITKIDDAQNDFTKISAENLNAIKDEFSAFSKEFNVSQQEIIDAHKTFDQNTIDRFSFVAESIKMVSENINIQTDIYKDFISKQTQEIKDFVALNEKNIKDNNRNIIEELDDKFKALEKFNANYSNDLSLVKDSLNDVLSKSEKLLQENANGLSSRMENILDSAKEMLSGVSSLQNYSEKINSSLEKVIEFNIEHNFSDILNVLAELEKFDVNFVNEFEDIKSLLNQMQESIETIPNKTTQALDIELKSVAHIAEDTLAEVKTLQSYSGNVLKSLDKITELAKNNDNLAVLEAIKDLANTKLNLVNDIEFIKNSLDEVSTKTDLLSLATEQNISSELKTVNTITNDTLAEVKTLQGVSGDILKALDKVVDFSNTDEKEDLLNAISELSNKNSNFIENLETIQLSISEVVDKTNEIPQKLSETLALEFKNVALVAEDTLAEIKVLQNCSGNILKSVDKILELNENDDKNMVLQAIKGLDEANIEFANDLETIKSSIVEVLNKAQDLPQVTTRNLAGEIKNVTDVANDALTEIKVLQDYSANLIKSVNKIVDYTDKNQNEDVFEALKDLEIDNNFAELFEKVEVFNNNFNIKIEFLEDQISQIKTMFSDVAVDIKNKEAELLQIEAEKVKEYYAKIEAISDSIVILDETLKLSGIEYKENIANLNLQLNDFIDEFNKIYNELSGTTQTEINNSLNELKQFISINSTNYNDKLVLIQEQFTQAFKDLYEVIKTNNFEIVESGQRAKDLSEAHSKLLENISSKIDIIAGSDLTSEILSQTEETQELIQILNAKVDSILNIDFNVIPDKQMLLNKKFLEYFETLNDRAAHLTELAQNSVDETKALELNQKIVALINEVDTKIDILASIDYSDDIGTILDKLSETNATVKELNTKIDILANTDYEETTSEILDNISETKDLLSKIDTKVDILASADDEETTLEILDSISETKDLLSKIDTKVDILASSDDEETTLEILDNISETKDLLSGIDTKIDILASSDYQDNFDEIAEKLSDNNEEIEKVSSKVSSNRSLLEELHTKLDVFVSTSDNDLLEDELQEIKDIILEQRDIINKSDNKDNIVVSQNIEKLLSKIDEISDTITEHDETSIKIKEDLVNTIVSVFSNSNFVEETEDIKDFVEEKTDEISKQLIDVKSQLATIKQNDVAKYSYTLADVESDIAKLRQIMSDISTSTSTPSTEFNQISRNIHNLTSSVDAISKNLTPAEIYQLKHNILKLNEDILSISSRTNKLLLNSDESQKTISEGLLAFSHIAFNLEERMNELSNKEFNEETATKLEKITVMLEDSASMDATFHKALMFLGEWVDAASETIESINDKADEINEVSEALAQLRKSVPDKLALVDLLEERFEEQQSRMDRLESKIDELTEITKLNSNLSIIQKVDKMERLLVTLNANIEKLTSYVD